MSILVVGSGPVGLSAASLLSRTLPHLSVTLLSSSPSTPPFDPTRTDVRTYALAPNNFDLLKTAGFEDVRYGKYGKMQVWDRSNPSFVSWSDKDGLGYVVEDNLITSTLQSNLPPSVDFIPSSTVTSITSLDATTSEVGYKSIDGKEKGTIKADLVVACDGGNSGVRRIMNIPTTTHSYGQVACCATVATNGEGDNTAYQRFLSTGPVAMLPLWDGMYNIVWTMTPEMAAEIKADPSYFVDRLSSAVMKGPESSGPPGVLTTIADGLGLVNMNEFRNSGSPSFSCPPAPTSLESPVLSFPLSTHFAHTYVKNNVALVGDAAHGVHPMAGQGLNLGLGDVEELVRRVGVAVEAGGEPGDKLQMGIYGEKRRRKVGVVQAGIHGLREVFNFQGLGGIGRAVGMAGVNMLPGVKDKLKQAAMGF